MTDTVKGVAVTIVLIAAFRLIGIDLLVFIDPAADALADGARSLWQSVTIG